MRRKNKVLLTVLAVIAALSVAAVVAVLSYSHVDHSGMMTKNQIAEYNSAVTLAARSYGSISSDEFVLIDTVEKELGGNTEVTFRVYRLPENGTFANYQTLRVKDVPGDFAPEYMGNGTARLVNGSMDRIIVNVVYCR